MKCFECGGEVLKTLGTVKMTRSDDSFIIYEPKYQLDCCLIRNRRSRHAILDHALRRSTLVS